MVNKIIKRLEEEYIEVKDDNDLYNNRAIFKAIDIVRQVAEGNNDDWIPCSERLPDDEEMHYVTMSNNKIGSAWYDHCSEKWYKLSYISSDVFEEVDIIAWMPLPEKYVKKDDK